MAKNEDSFAVDRPESSDNESDQEGKLLEISGDTKIFIKYEKEMVGGNLLNSTEISDEIYRSLYKNGYVRPSTLITEVSDSSSDDEVDKENCDCENCKKGNEMAALASKVEDMMIPDETMDEIAATKTLDTVDEADIEEDDSESDDETDTNEPDYLDLIDDKKDMIYDDDVAYEPTEEGTKSDSEVIYRFFSKTYFRFFFNFTF